MGRRLAKEVQAFLAGGYIVLNSPFNHGFLAPFAGYNCFGGKNNGSVHGMISDLGVDAIEFGVFSGYPVSIFPHPLHHIYLGAGLKLNAFVDKSNKFYNDYSFSAGMQTTP